MKESIQLRVCMLRIGTTLLLSLFFSAFFGSTPAFASKMTDLGTLGGFDSFAYGINSSGQIVGQAQTASGVYHAFVYSKGKMIDLGTLGGTSSCASAINSSGQIVGQSTTSSGASHAFLYSKGKMKDLGTLGGASSAAYGINDAGQVVGVSDTSSQGVHHAFLYSNGKMTDLGTLGGPRSIAYAINNQGQIVGESNISLSTQDTHAFLYSNGKMTGLGTFGGSYSGAYAINQKGQIVGKSSTSSGDYNYRAFIFSNGVMTDIGNLGWDFASAFGINQTGEIVGDSATSSGVPRGFLYSNGKMTDLGTLSGDANGGSDARAINDSGQIVGCVGTESGALHAFLYNQHFVTDNHNLANVDLVSNQFTLWMDISHDHKSDATLCSNYKFKVVADDKTIQQTSCRVLSVTTKLLNSRRYRISFVVPAETSKAASLTDGTVYACSIKTPSDCEEISELGEISVYGTAFDITKHAWQVQNGEWKVLSKTNTTTDFYKAGDVIDDYIVADWREDFWCTYMTIPKKCSANGLCYGLANSAISNFAHHGQSAWATDGTNGNHLNASKWKADIDKHWDNTASKTKSPFKPFVTDTLYSSGETWNVTDKWTPQAAKKALYHFVSQSYFLQGSAGARSINWVGKDQDRTSAVKSTAAEDAIVSIIKTGSPVSLAILWEQKGSSVSHQMAITQVLRWNGHTRYTVWDNNYPYPVTKSKPYAPYLAWYIDDSSDYPGSLNTLGGKYYKTIQKQEGTDYGIKYTLNNWYPYYLPTTGDSQNIYNSSKTSEGESFPGLRPYPEHMELLIVGGNITNVAEKDTGKKVYLEAEGAVSPYRGTIVEGAHGLGVSVSLSSSGTYGITVSKYEGFPTMKIFVTIPQFDGTLERIVYDNIAESKAEFLVGLGNSDRTLTLPHRKRAPTHRGILPTLLPPPSDLELVHGNGTVSLAWKNPTHPLFDGVKVVRKESSPPDSPDDGVPVYTGTGVNAVDSYAKENAVYCYTVFSMNAETPMGASRCIDTGRYSLSGTIPEAGEEATLTLTTEDGRIIHHAPAGKGGAYRFNNLENGAYLLSVQSDQDSEPTLVRSVVVEGGG